MLVTLKDSPRKEAEGGTATVSAGEKIRVPPHARRPEGRVLRPLEKLEGRNEALWRTRTQKNETPNHSGGRGLGRECSWIPLAVRQPEEELPSRKRGPPATGTLVVGKGASPAPKKREGWENRR